MTPAEETDSLPETPDVVATLVANHREFLAFLERRLADRAEAADILQESFARSLDKLEELRSDESAVAWFYRVLRNALIDRHRRHAARGRALEAFAVEVEKEEPEPELANAICRCISELSQTLKPEYRTILQRVELDGLAVMDFAEEAGITPNSARVRAFRAREALRKQVARSCGTCATHGCLDCTCHASTHG